MKHQCTMAWLETTAKLIDIFLKAYNMSLEEHHPLIFFSLVRTKNVNKLANIKWSSNKLYNRLRCQARPKTWRTIKCMQSSLCNGSMWLILKPFCGPPIWFNCFDLYILLPMYCQWIRRFEDFIQPQDTHSTKAKCSGYTPCLLTGGSVNHLWTRGNFPLHLWNNRKVSVVLLQNN